MNTCYWFIILREIPPSSVSGKLPSVRRSTVPGFVAAVGEPEGEGNREPVMQELVASVEKMKGRALMHDAFNLYVNRDFS